MWGGTGIQKWYVSYRGISIHPPRVGRDCKPCGHNPAKIGDFNPPSPCGEGRRRSTAYKICHTFQSTLPVWGGTTRSILLVISSSEFQSTLPVWGGTGGWLLFGLSHYISIHPPRVGRDNFYYQRGYNLTAFQSTLPVWGGTGNGRFGQTREGNFNPPSPCGEGHKHHCIFPGPIIFQSTLPVWGGTGTLDVTHPKGGFQSTLPVWGGTWDVWEIWRGKKPFQSTLPVWGGTMLPFSVEQRELISIHPPRVGRDRVRRFWCSIWQDISIHPPRVGRDREPSSTHIFFSISIHPPRVGRDPSCFRSSHPRPISIHPPRVGRDCCSALSSPDIDISIHPPRVGRDHAHGLYRLLSTDFNPPSPCGEGPLDLSGSR